MDIENLTSKEIEAILKSNQLSMFIDACCFIGYRGTNKAIYKCVCSDTFDQTIKYVYIWKEENKFNCEI